MSTPAKLRLGEDGDGYDADGVSCFGSDTSFVEELSDDHLAEHVESVDEKGWERISVV